MDPLNPSDLDFSFGSPSPIVSDVRPGSDYLSGPASPIEERGGLNDLEAAKTTVSRDLTVVSNRAVPKCGTINL